MARFTASGSSPAHILRSLRDSILAWGAVRHRHFHNSCSISYSQLIMSKIRGIFPLFLATAFGILNGEYYKPFRP